MVLYGLEINPAAFNRILWKRLIGKQAYPASLKQKATKERETDKD
ncbi:MAG TPA: hypothetical protein VK776_16510 [Bryobacteraceae bacterium]|jgi:hypothetical protein|nr:hypothetical protein [Bryobacteraceae bacterium]